MLATKVTATVQREKCRAETIEEFLARGGRIERIEAHPDPEGRVVRRGSRDLHLRPLIPHVLLRRRS